MAIALVVAGVVLGWIGRLAPAVPFLALSLPVRSMLGVVLVFLSLATLAATLTAGMDKLALGTVKVERDHVEHFSVRSIAVENANDAGEVACYKPKAQAKGMK